MNLLAAILVAVFGIVLLIWTVNLFLHILGWVLIVAAVVYVLVALFGGRNRTNL